MIFFHCWFKGSEGTVGAIENKENGGTWIDKIIKVLKVVAAPLVNKTVSCSLLNKNISFHFLDQ